VQGRKRGGNVHGRAIKSLHKSVLGRTRSARDTNFYALSVEHNSGHRCATDVFSITAERLKM
jgi:hypothetical protein